MNPVLKSKTRAERFKQRDILARFEACVKQAEDLPAAVSGRTEMEMTISIDDMRAILSMVKAGGVERVEGFQHTQGPWSLGGKDPHGQRIVMGPHHEIATCWHHCVTSIADDMEGNARIFANGLELLSLVKDANSGTLGTHTVSWQSKAKRVLANIRAPITQTA